MAKNSKLTQAAVKIGAAMVCPAVNHREANSFSLGTFRRRCGLRSAHAGPKSLPTSAVTAFYRALAP